MSIAKLAKLVMAGAMLGTLIIGQAGAAKPAKPVEPPVPVAVKLDNATCLGCHDGSKNKLEIVGSNGEKRPLFVVKPDKLAKSVHADMSCVSCHKEIIDASASHKKAEGVAKPNCVTCHEALWETAKKENLTKEKERLGIVVKNIEAYKKSFHALPGKEDKTKPKAYCEDCHNTHIFNIPSRGTSKRVEWHMTVPNVCGEKCHSDELEEYSSSVHGKALIDKKNPKAPVCIDCHTTHDIFSTSAEQFKVSLPQNCGNCHAEKLKTYRDTYHGQVNSLGYGYTAKCYDCHGSHGILPAKDPQSKVHPNNRLKTCQQCHDGKKDLRLATAGFVTFSPHAHANDFEKYPQMYIAARFMAFLLIAVFAFFWLHSGLWFYREYRERQDRKGQQHVRLDELPIEKGKYFQRFAWPWRLAHLIFALSVMGLVLTGMSAFYSQTAWASFIVHLIGGPHTAGIIHRICATIMLSIFFIHLLYVLIFVVSRKEFRWFGPTSMVPNIKDFLDIVGMFKWGIGLGPRPVFDRWTYWEKFDYWAVFWGMAMIGSSGAMLAFPDLTAAIMPGWVFNVGTVAHGEEAFLAAVFLFTVHFFNNHLRPEKYPPPDVVMFTGSVSLEEFKREHWAEYKRLADSGELAKHLVNVPSRPMTIASRILGLVLLSFGFTLLVLVAIGFFGHAGG